MLKMLAAVNRAMVFQYTPQQVKQAVTGQKNANKEQVIKMITSLTGYTPETDHEADAIAVGVAHILRNEETNMKVYDVKRQARSNG